MPHKIQCAKAIDNETGERMGYAYWALHGWAPEDIFTLHGEEALKPGPAKPASADRKKEEEEAKAVKESLIIPETEEQDSINRLIALTDRDMSEWREKLTPEGCKC